MQRLVGNYEIDMDGGGIAEPLGQWFAPSAGIVIKARVTGQIGGAQMFGNVPGVYADGYKASAVLDSDKDGELTGGELSVLRSGLI